MGEAVASLIDGPKGKKKVYNALEESFKEALQNMSEGGGDVQAFVGMFIDGTVYRLGLVSQGEPQWVLEPGIACQLFDTMLQTGAMPYALVEAHGPPPPGWGFIQEVVDDCYARHVVTQDGSVFGQVGKGKGKGFKGGGGGGYGKGKKGERRGKGGKGGKEPALADVSDSCRTQNRQERESLQNRMTC